MSKNEDKTPSWREVLERQIICLAMDRNLLFGLRQRTTLVNIDKVSIRKRGA